jgi:hypothetical protein
MRLDRCAQRRRQFVIQVMRECSFCFLTDHIWYFRFAIADCRLKKLFHLERINRKLAIDNWQCSGWPASPGCCIKRSNLGVFCGVKQFRFGRCCNGCCWPRFKFAFVVNSLCPQTRFLTSTHLAPSFVNRGRSTIPNICDFRNWQSAIIKTLPTSFAAPGVHAPVLILQCRH